MDKIIIFDAFGLVSIPHTLGHLTENENDFCLRPTVEGGFPAFYPDIEGKHPFSCPRATNSEEQHPDYTAQYERVAAFRTQLKEAHQETWGLLD